MFTYVNGYGAAAVVAGGVVTPQVVPAVQNNPEHERLPDAQDDTPADPTYVDFTFVPQ